MVRSESEAWRTIELAGTRRSVERRQIYNRPFETGAGFGRQNRGKGARDFRHVAIGAAARTGAGTIVVRMRASIGGFVRVVQNITGMAVRGGDVLLFSRTTPGRRAVGGQKRRHRHPDNQAPPVSHVGSRPPCQKMGEKQGRKGDYYKLSAIWVNAFSVCYPRGVDTRIGLVTLVPKLCLGTHLAKLRFAVAQRAWCGRARNRVSRKAFPNGVWEREQNNLVV